MKSETMRHLFCRSAFAACLVGGAMMLPSCEDDALTGQPSWLGNSIYERLAEEGNYQTTLNLINDLGLYDVLSQTGSKTLFVANDEAWEEWYRTNSWGVRSYEDLKASPAKQKLLFNSAMVNNAYLVELLSNVSGPDFGERLGKCMRRPSAVSVYDSVSSILPADMPMYPGEDVAGHSDPWAKYRNKTQGIVLLKDNSPAPMIHFLPAFMEHHDILDEDLQEISRDPSATTDDAWVNGRKILERDITCKNGYIHKVSGVIEPTVNMAEFIRQQAKATENSTSIWSSMLDRFSAPYYSAEATKEYQRLYGGNDSVFVLRYFSDWSAMKDNNGANTSNNKTPDGKTVRNLLPFDPGWNTYYPNSSDYTMYYEAGVMLVPTDEAVKEWWETEGKELKDQFTHYDSIPSLTLKDLLAANMVETLTDKVPTKFDENILDASTQLPLGVTKDNIVTSYMGCNGVVFVIDKVFAPRSYFSVAFPAQIREETMNVIYWAFENLDFLPYLNSMDTKYSLLLPTNNAMLQYVEPTSYGTTQPTMLEFSYDKTNQRVMALRYNCTIDANGNITKGACLTSDTQNGESQTIVKDRLEDLVDQLIIVGDIEDGNEYYKTKGGTPVRVAYTDKDNIQVYGLWQHAYNKPLTVVARYDKYETGNGRSYEINEQMPLASDRSVYNVLAGNSDYKEFYELIGGSDLMISEMGTGKYVCAGTDNKNVRLFENYNYTVYVPHNDSIRFLIDNDSLPTWDDLDYWDEVAVISEDADSLAWAKVASQVIKQRLTEFVRYHLQDNLVLIGAAPVNTPYESMLVNKASGRFFGLTVNCDHNGLQIIDQVGRPCNVLTENPANFNQVCREFWFTATNSKVDETSTIYMESDAVVHQIDGVLKHKNYGETWKQEVDRIAGLTLEK